MARVVKRNRMGPPELPRPNGSRLSCGRPTRRRNCWWTKSRARQGTTPRLPLKTRAPASFKRLLGADTNDLPWLHAPQGVQDSGNQGTELLEPIGARDDHNNGNAQCRDV